MALEEIAKEFIDMLARLRSELREVETRMLTLNIMSFEKEHVAKAGDYLDPVRFGELEIARARKILGEAAFATQYMQDPIYPENDLVDLYKINLFDPKDLNAHLKEAVYVHSCDTAFSPSETADYTAVTKWAYNNSGYYLLDAKRFKASSRLV